MDLAAYHQFEGIPLGEGHQPSQVLRHEHLGVHSYLVIVSGQDDSLLTLHLYHYPLLTGIMPTDYSHFVPRFECRDDIGHQLVNLLNWLPLFPHFKSNVSPPNTLHHSLEP